MSSSIQLLRSNNPKERPFPGNLLDGQPAINTNAEEPGLFFKATDGSIVKIGPAAITSDGNPPNTGGTGQPGNTIGELWLDKSQLIPVLKVYDGVQWVDAGSGSGGSPGIVTLQRWVKTASGGETSVSGPDSSAQILSYTPGLEEVFLNGVLLTRGVDYTADSGISITSLVPLTAGDEVTVLGWAPFNILGSIDGSNLIDGSVSQTKLSPLSITNAQVANNANISSSKLLFIPSGLASQSRLIESKLREYVSVKDFGATGDGVTDDHPFILAAWNHCLTNEVSLFFPAGTYACINKNFPFRSGTLATSNLDCKNITIFGEGPTTVLKTISNTGADVLQLNRVKNLHFRDFKITGELLTQSGAGTNAISITNGYDNLTFEDIWIENMPYVPTVVGTQIYGDGGKGLSIQEGAGDPCGSVVARNIFIKGCYYATGWDGNIQNVVDDASYADIEFTAEDCYIGVQISAAAPNVAIALGKSMGFKWKGAVRNCQIDALLARCVGVDLDLTVATDKTAAARRLNPNGDPWLNNFAGTTTVESLLAVSTKYSNIRIRGWKGECDYKARIGGNNNFFGPAIFSNWSEQSTFDLAIGGTAVTVDLAAEVFSGASLRDSTLTVTGSTAATIPSEFLDSANKNLVRIDGSFIRSYFGPSASLWTSGSGSPEGVISAPVGSLFTRTDGGAGTTLYVKESGSGNTGWNAK
jgi:hypothetical protein